MKRLESLNKRDEFDNKSKELKVNNSIYLLNKRLTELKNRISEKQEIASKFV